MMRVRSRFLLLPILSCVFLLSTSQTAIACPCAPGATVLDAFDQADEVVILKVLSVVKGEGTDEQSFKSATLIVEKVFKGKLKVRDEIVFGNPGGEDCYWTFDDKSIGEQSLLYLTRPARLSDPRYRRAKAPDWFAFSCGRSGPLTSVTEDLLYLENMSKRRGQTRISGWLGYEIGYQGIDVEGTRIKIIGKDKTYEVKTVKDGVFEIYGLPPGKYFVEPELRSGWKIDQRDLDYSARLVAAETGWPEVRTEKQVAVRLEPKKHATVGIFLTADNHVRGRVIGPKGQPMNRVSVYLLRPGQENREPTGYTDEQGRFDITGISPGEYVLVANKDGKLSVREPFRQVFYPNVSERERAAVINIGPGETVDNLDLLISSLEETITIEGLLRYSDGKPAADEGVWFRVTKEDDNIAGNVREVTDSQGRFRLTVLKGLTGELVSEAHLYNGLYRNCPRVDEILAKNGGKELYVQSNVVKLTTEKDVYEVELTMPFPRCERGRE